MFFCLLKKRGLAPILSAILLIVVSVILVVIILNWGSDFVIKGLEETTDILELKKEEFALIQVLEFKEANLEESGYIKLKNIGNSNLSITGYIISDNEGNNFDVTLDSDINLLSGGTYVILISEIMPGNKVNINLYNSEYFYSLPLISKSELVIFNVADLSANISSGTYYEPQTITFETETEDVEIYYTTDGKDPTKESERYIDGIYLKENTSITLKAIAFKAGHYPSNIFQKDYVIYGTVANIIATPSSGTIYLGDCIVLETDTDEAEIYYTLDGSEPNKDAYFYNGCILVDKLSDFELKAIALMGHWQSSEKLDEGYKVIEPVINVTNVFVGVIHTCALLSNDYINCWGHNYYGQLGDGTDIFSYNPVLTTGISSLVSGSSGAHHTCAIDDLSNLFCWGHNIQGQLGDGTRTDSLIPL